MKKIFFYAIIILLISIDSNAQSGAISFSVDGIKVIFKPTIKEAVSVRIFFKGGVSNYNTSQSGIERLSLAGLYECGTKKYSADEFKDSCDKYDIQMRWRYDYDYSNFSLLTAAQYFDTGWDLFSEAVLNPSYNRQEVERLKEKIIAGIKSSQSSPDAYLETMEVTYGFANTPYAPNPAGTEQTVASLTYEDLQKYYTSMLNKNQIFIVIAGNLTKEEIIQKIHSSFADIPSTSYKEINIPQVSWQGNEIKTEKRNLATNYIGALMNAPQIYGPDYLPFRMAVAALNGALFSNLRSKLSLSYDPTAKYVLQKMPYCEMKLSTTQPKKAIDAMIEQVDFIKNNRISDDYLDMLKNNLIVTEYLKQETAVDITANLGLAEVLGGWENAENLSGKIENVTGKQIQSAFNKYVNGISWVYLGN